MALRYTTERLETCTDHDNWDTRVVPLLKQIFELMDEDQDGSVDEVEGALVSFDIKFLPFFAHCFGRSDCLSNHARFSDRSEWQWGNLKSELPSHLRPCVRLGIQP